MSRRFPARPALLLAAALLAACASAPPPAGAPPGAVSVSWGDPARFTEARENPRDTPAAREAWLSDLGRHLAERAAAVLPPDEKLDVRFTDVRRAGGFEPWRGPQAADVRIVRDIYPPRIVLEFQRRAADGRVLASGQRTLRDAAFLMRPNAYPDDPLGYEKMLLDDWVRQEFGARR
ncbi:DUF3016 domain-containing protein [Pseudorhodoferax sp.]|uniref:DUF3016 domain-containing protein n=1 Tax=Pseudorhodoferax sp. TaxID=1993553 RepID=UPI0039E37512